MHEDGAEPPRVALHVLSAKPNKAQMKAILDEEEWCEVSHAGYVKGKDGEIDPTRRCIHTPGPLPVGEDTRLGAEEDTRQCFLRQMSRLCTNPS
jgi:hypothetical protein